jgi:hypothetical protein
LSSSPTRSLAAAVALQGATLAGRVGPRKDPVLPGREPAEYLRRNRFIADKAQIRLHSGQCVRRQAGALFKCQPDLVFPIQFVRSKGHEAKLERRGCIERHRAECPARHILIEACR